MVESNIRKSCFLVYFPWCFPETKHGISVLLVVVHYSIPHCFHVRLINCLYLDSCELSGIVISFILLVFFPLDPIMIFPLFSLLG